MVKFKNPLVQEVFQLYENGAIDKATYIQRLREINLDAKHKTITSFYSKHKTGQKRSLDALFTKEG
jgi:uncharacterized protein YkvS